MKIHLIICMLFMPFLCIAQNGIKGKIVNDKDEAISFANVVLYSVKDSSLVKVETTDEEGRFTMSQIATDSCYLVASFIGYKDLRIDNLVITEQDQDLGTIKLETNTVELQTAVVTADRPLVEIKPDRTIFNVQGTINSTGENATGLLRKAPGVQVNNNGDTKILGRSGVALYVDGKRSALSGEDLTEFLNNLNAEQIDRIEIISSPGVKYEAQGNAGIIDIKLKKNEMHGTNGAVTFTGSKGRKYRGNTTFSGNYRNKHINTFGTLGIGRSNRWSDLLLKSTQNGFELEEYLDYNILTDNYSYKWGLDYFINPKTTIGFLASGINRETEYVIDGSNQIATIGSGVGLDSILLSQNITESISTAGRYNLNYRFDNKSSVVNIDLDYGRYHKDRTTDQPNRYVDAIDDTLLSVSDNAYDSDTKINIFTAKVDYEKDAFDGRLSLGAKYSNVQTENEFLFFDVSDGQKTQNDFRSNLFDYDEEVYAAYVNYSKTIQEKWNLSIGTRLEQTYSTGDLTVFDDDLQQPPVEREYLNIFPNVGISYEMNPKNTFNINYGKRINRPNYRRLNPFKSQVNELGFDQGNPFLNPEIAHNLELGYTYARRYSFKLAYSYVKDQVVGLIGPDDSDPRAGFLGYGNLGSASVLSFNVSAPLTVTKKWRVMTNVTFSYTDNFADYGSGVIIDTDATNFYIFQQHSFKLPWQIRGELSGWYTGPDIWDGILFSKSQYSIGAGLKRSFFGRKLDVKLNINDIFYSERFRGNSSFNGRVAETSELGDTRRVSLGIRYKFGNKKVKSRKRKTGMEDESKRAR